MDSLENKDIFSRNLRTLMQRFGKDRNQICDELGFKYSTFNDWYNGKKYPRIDKIEMLANYFGVLKSDLIEEKEITPGEQALTDGEKTLLELFRKIPSEQQEMVLQMIRAALNAAK